MNRKCDLKKKQKMIVSTLLQYLAHSIIYSTTAIQNLTLLSDVYTNSVWDTTQTIRAWKLVKHVSS